MWRVLVLTVAVVAIAAEPPKDDANKKDLKRLQGVWQVRHIRGDGEECDDPLPMWVVISEDKFALALGLIGDVSGPLKLDAAKVPPAIDIAFEKDRVSLYGIYEVKGDTLRICFTSKRSKSKQPSKDRPKEFDARKDSPYTLWVLKRVKD
jgi:uncharacterized protein (TIGR03067 family)